jgi:hypothetical protein
MEQTNSQTPRIMKYSRHILKLAMLSTAWIVANSTLHAQNLALDPAVAEKAEKKAEEKAEEKNDKAEKPEGKAEPNAEELIKLSQNREELAMPGMKIMVKKGYIDVDAKVCLTEGMLELIACTKDSKEHEALISVEPKAAHIHAALLLIGAQPGNPAMRKEVETEDGPRWIDIPPRGQEIDVYLVFNDEEGKLQEYPIKQFIRKGEEDPYDLDVGEPKKKEDKEEKKFPTNTFLFTGSHVFKDGESDPVYLADESGNVISLSTFGDELLALPGVHANNNERLVWGVDSTYLPALETKIILRLKPKKPAAAAEPKK